MKTKIVFLLSVSLLLVACQTATPLPLTSTKIAEPTERPTSTPRPPTDTATPSPTTTPTPKPKRIASFGSVENSVEARGSEADEFAAASVGMKLPAGGQARTGADGRARLDLSPDATIIRLAPNTLFAVTALDEEEGNPLTQLELLIGQLYIILNGGELDVKTPSGVAAVSGSMLGVFYDPEARLMTATCLEGHCTLGNGTDFIELIEGQAADILDGVLSKQPRLITDAELGGWLAFAPELLDRLDKLPNLRNRIDNLPPLPDLFDLPNPFAPPGWRRP